MADKVPIKASFDAAGETDGLAEFASGDTVPTTHGGTGLASLGSAGQVIKVNAGANGLEWGAVEAVFNIDGMTDKSSITIADTDKIPISDGGAEGYIVPTQIRGYLIKDEDDMASDSATHMPSQQSVKAFLDTHAALGTHLTLIDEDDMATNSATRPPSQQSVKAYVDAGDLSLIDEDDMATDSSTRPPSQQSVKAYVDAHIIDEDDMASNSAAKPASQQSVKAYADTKATTSNRLDEFANPTSALDINDQEIGKAVLKDYAEKDVAISYGTDLAIDLANGNTGSVTLTGNVSGGIDFTNVPTDGTATFTLKITQDGTGSRTLDIDEITVNGGGHVTGLTPGNAGITLTTAANSVDLVTFLFFDAGTPLINALLDFKNS